MTFFAIAGAFLKTAPYLTAFFAAFLLSLFLTPIVRNANRRLGMVDIPGGRRINKTPIPRGGGVAVIASFTIAVIAYVLMFGNPLSASVPNSIIFRMLALSAALGVIGFVDDKFGMKPIIKLLGQIAVAVLAFLWCNVGFHSFFGGIPLWLDLPLTVFWIVGAINAFNLIDGLDGLASGLAVIAAAGMAGTLFFAASPSQTVLHLAFIGSVLGFLRYNFNPASVFLGDTGAMFLGFFLSTVALMTHAGDSFLVCVGIPTLAMGVPIFDTALAIVRRMVRAALRHEEASSDVGNAKVMQADSDHTHHRILRRLASQRKAVALLYGIAIFLVLVGIGAVALRDRAAGLFIVAFIIAAVIIVKDMSRVELLDAGKLADSVAHNHSMRRRAALFVPMLVFTDACILVGTWYLTEKLLKVPLTSHQFHTFLPLRVIPVFIALAVSRAYSTVWSRALLTNYIRLVVAIAVGVLLSTASIVLLGYQEGRTLAFPAIHFGLLLLSMLTVRSARQLLRDYFHSINVRNLADSPDTSRVLVFGAGLRCRAFCRELVRSAGRSKRMVVGVVDDDLLLRGRYIGGMRIDGPHMDAMRIVRKTRADSVVIACDLPPERLRVVVETFRRCGVKVTTFNFVEQPA